MKKDERKRILRSKAKAERGRETLENATHAKKPRRREKRA